MKGREKKISTIVIPPAASTIGNTQYPSTQTLWKNELLYISIILSWYFFVYVWPPRNLALSVNILAPPQIMIKIVPNTTSELFEAFKLRMLGIL